MMFTSAPVTVVKQMCLSDSRHDRVPIDAVVCPEERDTSPVGPSSWRHKGDCASCRRRGKAVAS